MNTPGNKKGECVKQKSRKEPENICFVKLTKQIFVGLWGQFCFTRSRLPHKAVRTVEITAVDTPRKGVSRLFLLFRYEYMNVCEGYRALIAKFALSGSGTVLKKVNIEILGSPTFTFWPQRSLIYGLVLTVFAKEGASDGK